MAKKEKIKLGSMWEHIGDSYHVRITRASGGIVAHETHHADRAYSEAEFRAKFKPLL